MTIEEFIEWEMQEEQTERSIQFLRQAFPAPLNEESILVRNLDDQKRQARRNFIRKKFFEEYKKSSANQDKELQKQIAKGFESALSKLFK